MLNDPWRPCILWVRVAGSQGPLPIAEEAIEEWVDLVCEVLPWPRDAYSAYGQELVAHVRRAREMPLGPSWLLCQNELRCHMEEKVMPVMCRTMARCVALR